jgi:hypothetical protein
MTDHADLLRRLEAGKSGQTIDGDFALALGIVPKGFQRSPAAPCVFEKLRPHNPDRIVLADWAAPSVSSVDAMLALARNLWPALARAVIDSDTEATKVEFSIYDQGRFAAPIRVVAVSAKDGHALAAAILKAYMQEQQK